MNPVYNLKWKGEQTEAMTVAQIRRQLAEGNLNLMSQIHTVQGWLSLDVFLRQLDRAERDIDIRRESNKNVDRKPMIGGAAATAPPEYADVSIQPIAGGSSPKPPSVDLYIAKNGAQTGPFTEAQARGMLAGGLVSSEDMAWTSVKGGDWQPLRVVLARSLETPPAPPPGASSTSSDEKPNWAFSKSQAHARHTGRGETQDAVASQVDRLAGFWRRVGACIIDSIILQIGIIPLAFVLGLFMGASGVRDQNSVVAAASILGTVCTWFYYALFESAEMQATPGKRACGFIVTDLEGHRITLGLATGRYWGKFISALFLGIGFLMCGWTKKKQCLHDMMSDCIMPLKG